MFRLYSNAWFYILFIDLLTTVRYNHEAWARVVSVEKKTSIQSISTSKTTMFRLPMVTHAKRQCFNVSGLKQKLRICIHLDPEPELGPVQCARVCGELSMN